MFKTNDKNDNGRPISGIGHDLRVKIAEKVGAKDTSTSTLISQAGGMNKGASPLVMPNENGQTDYVLAYFLPEGEIAGICDVSGGFGFIAAIAVGMCVPSSINSENYAKVEVTNVMDGGIPSFTYILNEYTDSACLEGETQLYSQVFTTGYCVDPNVNVYQPYSLYSLHFDKRDLALGLKMMLQYTPGNSMPWARGNGFLQAHYGGSTCAGNVAAMEFWSSDYCYTIPESSYMYNQGHKSAKLAKEGCGNNLPPTAVLWDFYATTDCTGGATQESDYEHPNTYCDILGNYFFTSFPFDLDGTYDKCVGTFQNDCDKACPDQGYGDSYIIKCGAFSQMQEDNFCEFDGEKYCCKDCCVADAGAIAGLVIGILVFLTCSIILCCACCTACPCHSYWRQKLCGEKKEEQPLATPPTQTVVDTPHGQVTMTNNPMRTTPHHKGSRA
jgi:hypothetical protein